MSKNIAVILAGGVGSRSGLGTPKQFFKVAGKTVIEHTVSVFDNHRKIDEIAIVTNPSGQGHERDFLTVGSMGHASQIALGIALEKTDRRIWCFDGDGAAIMHMGSMAIVASKKPANYIHVIFNNGAHDSVGGQPTVGLKVDLTAVARGVGYAATYSVSTKEELLRLLPVISSNSVSPQGAVFLEIKVRKGHRKELGRPTTTPIENKQALMGFLAE